MPYDYASMFKQMDSVERRVKQFDADTVEGRRAICKVYKNNNIEFLQIIGDFDEKRYEEVAQKYIRLGLDGLLTSTSCSRT